MSTSPLRFQHPWMKRHLANALSCSRIAFAPAVFGLVRLFRRHDPWLEAGTAVFTTLLMVTDALDGHYARKYSRPTVFGAAIDPLADSMFFISTFFAYMGHSRFYVSPIAGVVIVWRETLMHMLRRWAAWHKVSLGAKWSGKIKTATQCVLVVLMMTVAALADWGVVGERLVANTTEYGWYFIAFINVVSMPEYLIFANRLRKEIEEKEKAKNE